MFLSQSGCKGRAAARAILFRNAKREEKREKKDVGDLQPSKALKCPLFCDSARSSISASFRDIELIRKGQRAPRLQEVWRVLFLCCRTTLL